MPRPDWYKPFAPANGPRCTPTRVPSAKRLAVTFGWDLDTAKAVRDTLRDGWSEGYGHWSHTVQDYLDRVVKFAPPLTALGEPVWLSPEPTDHPAGAIMYLNTGDSYGTTLLFNRETDCWSIGSWAGTLEALERRHGQL